MTIRIAIATIVGCTVLLGGVGASVGYGLGTLAPGYYQHVFPQGRSPDFDPISVGVGQGLTQGTAGGVLVGLALVALFSWRETRVERGADSLPLVPGSVARRLFRITASILALGFCLSSGVVLGVLVGERGAYHRRYLEEQEAIAPVLAGDPAFAWVELHEYSAGGAYLTGEVPAADDLGRLRDGITRAVGEHRAKEVVRAVGVSR